MSDDPKTEQPSSSEPRVLYETRNEGSIAVITMNRPRYRNPLSSQMMAELDEAFIRAEDDPDVRVIVLRGEGPTFSGGHDLGSPDALATRAERENEPMGNRYPRTRGMDVDPHLRWRDIPKPTIAVVQGACIYAAWMLASAMDVIFAAEDAQFLPTNFAYFAVPWDIGARRAKYLMFDNRFLTAREAMDWGFVQEVHPSEELEAAARASWRGIWRESGHGVKRAGDVEQLNRLADTFQIVEGRVLSVGRAGTRVYLNFGSRWSRDFTLVAASARLARFRAAGVDLETLAGRRVRVRGWLERRGGPMIEIEDPEQIELAEEAGRLE